MESSGLESGEGGHDLAGEELDGAERVLAAKAGYVHPADDLGGAELVLVPLELADREVRIADHVAALEVLEVDHRRVGDDGALVRSQHTIAGRGLRAVELAEEVRDGGRRELLGSGGGLGD